MFQDSSSAFGARPSPRHEPNPAESNPPTRVSHRPYATDHASQTIRDRPCAINHTPRTIRHGPPFTNPVTRPRPHWDQDFFRYTSRRAYVEHQGHLATPRQDMAACLATMPQRQGRWDRFSIRAYSTPASMIRWCTKSGCATSPMHVCRLTHSGWTRLCCRCSVRRGSFPDHKSSTG